jgi:translation initiation factor 1
MLVKNLSTPDEIIYSTHPEFEYEYANIQEPKTLNPKNQKLIISLSKRKIDGALVTTVTGFIGKRKDLIKVEQALEKVCKTNGSTRMYDIIMMRDVRKRAYIHLRNQGYDVQFGDS